MFNILSYCSGGVRLAFLLLVFVALAVPGIEQSVCGQNRIADSKVKQDDPDRQRTLAALYKVKPGIQSSQKRAAELLFEFSSSARTEADCAKFFDQLGKIPAGPDGLKGMQVLIQTKTLIEQASINNKGISSLCLGSKLAGGGTEVERVLLSYRRNVVNQAIAQVAREFAGKSGNAEVFLAEIGKWASQSPNNFTFAGDIDFSFVSADKNLSWQMKQRFDQIIQMKTGLTPVQFDTVCTAHGRATPDVYILEHGELYGNSEMKKGSLKKIDLGSGTVSSETVPGEKVLADITRQLSTNPDFGEVKNFKSGQTEPGISMEMARHLENDIIKPKIFDPVDSIIKASKYVERSVASSKVNGGDLADFAAAMTRAAKTSDFATMAKLLRQKFPGMKLIIDTRGAKPTARIEMSHESVKNYFDECSKLIWNNAKTRLEDSINKLKYKLSSAQASELTKLRAEAKALKEMLATQIMVCKHDNVAVPPEIDLLSKRLDVIVDSFTDKHGLKKITAEEMQQKKFIEECIKAKTPTMRAIAIAYICKIGSAVNYVALEAPNTILDYIDQRLLGELRGENSDFDEYMRQLFEIKKNLSEGTKPRPTTIQNLQSKAASVIRSCNTSMNKVLSATATRRAGLKVMQAVNLYNELEAYYQGYNSDGFYGVSTEFFRRRIPLGAATDAFVQENYLRVGIELVYTIFPPVAIPEGLYGMAVQAHGWGVRRLDSWNYKATVDELYAGCEFAKVGTGKGWRLVSLKYAGRKYGSRDEALLLPLKNRSVWRVLSQELRQFPALKAFEEILDRSDISSGHSGEWPYRYEGLSKYGSQLQTLYLQEADKVVLEYFEGVIEELERRKGLSTGTGYADIALIERELGCKTPLLEFSGDSAADVKLYDSVVGPYRKIKQINSQISTIAREWGAELLLPLKPECSVESIIELSSKAEKLYPALKEAISNTLADVRVIVGKEEIDKVVLQPATRARLHMAWTRVVGGNYHRWYETYQEELEKLRKSKHATPAKVSISIDEPVVVAQPAVITARYDRENRKRQVEWKILNSVLEKFSSSTAEYARWTPAHPGKVSIVLKMRESASGNWIESNRLDLLVLPKGEAQTLKVRLLVASKEVFEAETLPVQVETVVGSRDDPFVSYFWSENGIKTGNTQSPFYQFKGKGKKGIYTLSVAARTAHGRLAPTESAELRVLPGELSLRAFIMPNDLHKVKAGEILDLNAVVARKSDEGEFSYIWNLNGMIAGRSETCKINTAKINGDSIKVSVRVTESFNGRVLRAAEAQKEIEIVRSKKENLPAPVERIPFRIYLNAEPKQLQKSRIANIKCLVENLPHGDKIQSYKWTGCNSSNSANTYFEGSSPGISQISCTVKTVNGLTASASCTVQVIAGTIKIENLPAQVYYGQTSKISLSGIEQVFDSGPEASGTESQSRKLSSGEDSYTRLSRLRREAMTKIALEEQAKLQQDGGRSDGKQVSRTYINPLEGLQTVSRPLSQSARTPVPTPKPGGTAQRTYIWHSSPNIQFASTQTSSPINHLTYTRMGKVKIWAEIVNGAGASKRILESNQAEVTVSPPKFSISFNPASGGKIGQEIKATIREEPAVKDQLIDFRWLAPASAERREYAKNSRIIGFVPRNNEAVELRAGARVPVFGDSICDSIEANYTAIQSCQVRAEIVQAALPARQWVQGKGLEGVQKTYRVDEQIRLRASISGQSASTQVRWLWSTNEGTSISGNTMQEPYMSRHEPGGAEATVIAKDSQGIVLGRASVSASVEAQETAPPRKPLSVSIRLNKEEFSLGEQAQASASVGGGLQPYTYAWELGKQRFSGPKVVVAMDRTGYRDLYLTVTDSKGQSAFARVSIKTKAAEIKIKIQAPDQLRVGQPAKLRAFIEGARGSMAYRWSGELISTLPEPEYIPRTAGNKQFMLEVTDAFGSKGLTLTSIRVAEAPAEKKQAPAAVTNAVSANSEVKAAACRLQGVREFGAKNYRSAVESFSDAIKLDPRNYNSYYNRANSYGKLGNYEKSIADYTEAIRIASTEDMATQKNANSAEKCLLDAMVRRGYAAELAGKYELARADCREVLRRDPGNAIAAKLRVKLETSASTQVTKSPEQSQPAASTPAAQSKTTLKISRTATINNSAANSTNRQGLPVGETPERPRASADSNRSVTAVIENWDGELVMIRDFRGNDDYTGLNSGDAYQPHGLRRRADGSIPFWAVKEFPGSDGRRERKVMDKISWTADLPPEGMILRLIWDGKKLSFAEPVKDEPVDVFRLRVARICMKRHFEQAKRLEALGRTLEADLEYRKARELEQKVRAFAGE